MYPAGSTGCGPITQNSTSVYAPLVGSLMDRSLGIGFAVGYAVKEQGGVNGITFKIQASIDGVNWSDDVGELPVAAGNVVTAFGSGSGHRYYQLVIKDTVANSHGVAVVNGYAH